MSNFGNVPVLISANELNELENPDNINQSLSGRSMKGIF